MKKKGEQREKMTPKTTPEMTSSIMQGNLM